MERSNCIAILDDLAVIVRQAVPDIPVVVEPHPGRLAAALTQGRCIALTTRPPSTQWESSHILTATHELQAIFAMGDDHPGMWDALDAVALAAGKNLGIESTDSLMFSLPNGGEYPGLEIKLNRTYTI